MNGESVNFTTMATSITHSPEETQALGAQWVARLQPGTVVALVGDLGAGKTQLVKGVLSGLGFKGRVQSPTFALINEYSAAMGMVFHLDLYRLETREDVLVAGLDEFLVQPDGITLVEWPERWFDEEFFQLKNGEFVMPSAPGVWRVVIETLSETERRLVYEDFGD